MPDTDKKAMKEVISNRCCRKKFGSEIPQHFGEYRDLAEYIDD